MISLQRILEHEILGQRARFERYMAEMAFHVAAGSHIDPERSPRFGEQIEKIYSNPFHTAEEKMTAEDIRQRTLDKINKLREAMKG